VTGCQLRDGQSPSLEYGGTASAALGSKIRRSKCRHNELDSTGQGPASATFGAPVIRPPRLRWPQPIPRLGPPSLFSLPRGLHPRDLRRSRPSLNRSEKSSACSGIWCTHKCSARNLASSFSGSVHEKRIQEPHCKAKPIPATISCRRSNRIPRATVKLLPQAARPLIRDVCRRRGQPGGLFVPNGDEFAAYKLAGPGIVSRQWLPRER
jgi:hypothetical protein